MLRHFAIWQVSFLPRIYSVKKSLSDFAYRRKDARPRLFILPVFTSCHFIFINRENYILLLLYVSRRIYNTKIINVIIVHVLYLVWFGLLLRIRNKNVASCTSTGFLTIAKSVERNPRDFYCSWRRLY